MMPFRNSIAFRLFAITFIVMMLFVGLLLATLGSGFSTFYEQRQKKDVAHELKALGERYRADAQQSVKPGMPAYITQFETDYYAKVAVLSIRDGVVETVVMGGSGPGQQIMIKGGSAGVQLPPAAQMILVPNPPLQSELTGITLAAQQWVQDGEAFRKVMGGGETIVYRSEERTGEATSAVVNQLIAVTPVSGDGGRNGTVLLAASSLQPVKHAASIFQGLSVYVFGAALLFVLLLSFVYARFITKPLIRLNALTGRLANLDFHARTRWKRKDEIGELARSFDVMADNLQSALDELQEANEKLREDIEREKRLERMRRDFIAGVSHELKTPLSLIGGYAEGLRDRIADGAKREKYAEVILEETQRMTVIVSDMLDLSHLESGQYRLKPETIQVAELVRNAEERANALCRGKTIRFRTVIAPEPDGRLFADRFRIDQVLTNLLSNAVRHTPDNGAIELSASRQDNEWVIGVYNEGTPIPEDELPRLWGQFYRVDKARSRESGGTGIGLAIVRQILELHGSRYDVRNERNGVAFSFTLRAEKP